MIWEYLIGLPDGPPDEAGMARLAPQLNALGQEHWELAAITPDGRFFFKRPVPEPQSVTVRERSKLEEIRAALEALGSRHFTSRAALLNAIDKERGLGRDATFRYLHRRFGSDVPAKALDFIKWLRGVAGDTGDGAGDPITLGRVTDGRIHIERCQTIHLSGADLKKALDRVERGRGKAPEAGAEGGA
jgi:hypothetical protein